MKPGVFDCCFCFRNTLKFTYEHLQFLKFFRGYTPGPPLKGRGRVWEGEGGRDRDRWGENGDKGGEEIIREGRERKKKRNGKEGEGGDRVWEGRRGTGGDGRERRERGGKGKGTQAGKFLDPPSLQNSATPLIRASRKLGGRYTSYFPRIPPTTPLQSLAPSPFLHRTHWLPGCWKMQFSV
jgi:hypothetical protein